MYEYISGRLSELNPAEAIVEAGGIGYTVLISLGTFSSLEGKTDSHIKLFLHHLLREDEESLYGFAAKEERALFRQLISVNGVGAGTARMMLSAMSCDELQNAIIGGDVARIKSIKGIGTKTAERIILELRDKIVKGEGKPLSPASGARSEVRAEAFNALVLLGFAKPNVDKALDMALKQTPDATLENLIKICLKIL